MAEIQFAKGVTEEIVPEVRLTRSVTGQTGTATFIFSFPKILSKDSTDEVTGMYLIDEEGEIVTREVKGKFVNGQPTALESVLVINSAEEWERFMRFMQRYADEHDLGFTQA